MNTNKTAAFKVAFIIALIIINFSMSTSSSKRQNPDFAYPEKVIADSQKAFKQALGSHDYPEALGELIDLCVAHVLKSDYRTSEIISLVDSAAGEMPAPYKEIAKLIEAQVLVEAYENERYIYDGRKLPLELPFPKNISEWSAEMFADSVYRTIKSITGRNQGGYNESSTHLLQLFDFNDKSDIIYFEKAGLTIGDFIMLKGISLLSTFSKGSANDIIPFFPKNNETDDLTPSERCRSLALDIIDRLISDNRNNSIMAALALKEKLELISEFERKEIIKSYITEMSGTEGEAILLIYYKQYPIYEEEYNKWLFSQCQKWIEKFPNSIFTDKIKNIISEIEEPTVSVSIPKYILPYQAAECEARMNNINKTYVLIYQVPESILDKRGSFSMKDFKPSTKPLEVIEIETEEEKPFTQTKKFILPELAAGTYLAISSINDKLEPDWRKTVSYYSFHVSSLSVVSVTGPGSEKVYIVDAHNQQPIEGARVNIFKDSYPPEKLTTCVSGADGSISVPYRGSYLLNISKGHERLYFSNYQWRNEYEPQNEVKANIFTDLSVYKPGDNINFTLVCWEKKSAGGGSLFKQKDITVSLWNSNDERVASVDLKTDNSGRANGEFKIPDSGLLGNYMLTVEKGEEKETTEDDIVIVRKADRFGAASIEVAEYKVPKFEVLVKKTSESNDTVSFKGSVRTFSGMPLGGAKIDYKIKFRPWWRFYGEEGTYDSTLTVGPNGDFEIKLPTSNLKNTRFEKGNFTFDVTAVSPDGETQKAPSIGFSLGEAYSIAIQIPSKYEVKDSIMRLRVNVNNMLGLPVSRKVNYKVRDDQNNLIGEGIFMSPMLELEADKFPSGLYKFFFTTEGGERPAECETILYRFQDNFCPYQTSLWLPKTEYIVKDEDQAVYIPVGSGYDHGYILYMVVEDSTIVKREWLEINGENREIKVDAPNGYSQVRVWFSGMHDFKHQIGTVTVRNAESCKKGNLKVESFREKISAGSKEKWRFSFTVDSVPEVAYGAAVMTDKAINSISPFKWDFSPNLGPLAPHLSITGLNNSFGSSYLSPGRPVPYVRTPNLLPRWNTYGYGFVRYFHDVFYSKAKVITNYSIDINEDMEIPDQDLRSVSHSSSVKASYYEAQEMVSEESSAVTSGLTEEKDDIPLRQIEMPVAFFMPLLESNQDGSFDIEFEVPDFNTTWQFRMFGYDEQLISANLLMETVASKPVMAKANMPMYLRTGDRTTLRALMFNNSGETRPIAGRIVVIDPINGEKIYSKDFAACPVEAAGSASISADFDVADRWSQIEVRVYAISDNFSDGESAVIPIYPSSSPVIESTQFYLGAKTGEVTVNIPKVKEDANVTLKYCFNPIWECMLSMPAISIPESNTILSLTKALYANVAAEKTVMEFPQIKDDLAKLIVSDEMRNLESNLEADSSLKIVGLEDTPWVNNAAAERRRILRLNTLLNPDYISEAKENLIERIGKRQMSDGGWSWCEGMESSYFITSEILLEFGEMKTIGAFPGSLQGPMERGFDYCDNQWIDIFKKEKKISVSSILEYLYTKSFFPEVKDKGGFTKIREEALIQIKENWKKFDIRNKACAALLFHRLGHEANLVNDILESLSQFAVKDEQLGWYYDNVDAGYKGWTHLLTTSMVLNAFAEIRPDSEAVDGLRQWLLLQKETEDWGSRDLTVQVIQSILGSGSQWGVNAGIPQIFAGEKELQIISPVTGGSFTLSVNPSDISGKKLTIRKVDDTPAWGGVISQFIAPMKEIKEVDGLNLKVSKQVLKIEEGPEGVKATKGEIKVGDKLRVTLTLTCEKDMDYVALVDERSASIQPDEWLSRYARCGDFFAYRETRDNRTSFFIDFLPKGVYVISYDCHADRAGEYSLGIATAQSLYSPQQAAHSAGSVIKITE